MGVGKVKEMSAISFYQQIVIPLVSWIGLACSWKLYVLGVGYLLSVLVWQLYVQCHHLHQILINLWNERITKRVAYFKEIFSYQWRIAISWVSGYYIFNFSIQFYSLQKEPLWLDRWV